jgi:Transposase DDE domain
MFPEFYQKVLRAHLSESQYLTLQLLVLLLQSHRQVSLGRLASVFPQPIQYESRIRNLQRFLILPQLSLKVLWFPIVKYWLAQEFKGRNQNRAQRRELKKLRHPKNGALIVAIDRTQWKDRNLFMVSIVWGKHAFPVYWEILDKRGNSDLSTQTRLLKITLKLLKSYPVVVLGDREFHSPKLAAWLEHRGIRFAFRQRKSAFIQECDSEYQALKTMGFQPGMSRFFCGIFCNKEDHLGPFNLAAYWKRQYRGKGPKEPWYILTNLPTLKQALELYRSRWGIEMMFKNCKSGGYNLEDTLVNTERFLALVLTIAFAYSLATCQGLLLKQLGVQVYATRLKEDKSPHPRYSDFTIGLYGYLWKYAMDVWSHLAEDLMSLKPHKRYYFQRGLNALSVIRSTL